MQTETKQQGKMRKISILEARELSHQVGVLIVWRPEPMLPDVEQYCLTPDVK